MAGRDKGLLLWLEVNLMVGVCAGNLEESELGK
jgi:hypothetical protein